MAESLSMHMYLINKWVYQYYSKGAPIERSKKIAWVTSFVPIEILEALDVAYIYPESYAAVIAASGKAQGCLEEAEANGFPLDCCSYSACFNGCLSLGKGPRGLPPQPDILIASNNQCNTLPNWWNLLSEQLGIPLIVLDYPGEYNANDKTKFYVENQHKNLIKELELLSGNKFDKQKLLSIISISRENVGLWTKIIELFPKYKIEPSILFDYISPLVVARCSPYTTQLYKLMLKQLSAYELRNHDKKIYWVGYPFWYDSQRYLSANGMQIVGSNYITWWNFDYNGTNIWDMLYYAYNFTALNLTSDTRERRLTEDIIRTNAKGVIINHNKSCKRDFSTFSLGKCPLPFASIESDMIDAKFLDTQTSLERISILLSVL